MRPEDVPMEVKQALLDALPMGSEAHLARGGLGVLAAAVWPLIAQAERERCAKVAETAQMAGTIKPDGFYVGPNAPHAIASAIRALPDTGE